MVKHVCVGGTFFVLGYGLIVINYKQTIQTQMHRKHTRYSPWRPLLKERYCGWWKICHKDEPKPKNRWEEEHSLYELFQYWKTWNEIKLLHNTAYSKRTKHINATQFSKKVANRHTEEPVIDKHILESYYYQLNQSLTRFPKN